jgi:hypothetical protein
MRLSKMTVAAATVAILAGGVTFWTASAQPAGDPPKPTQPGGPAGRPGRGERPGPGAGERGPRSEWQEKYKDELRDHPRMARALVSLHDAKDYMDKAPNDFGGHKAAAIKACDDAIKEITEAMKFDPKRGEGKPGERKPEAKPADAKPAEPTPATPPAPAGKP